MPSEKIEKILEVIKQNPDLALDLTRCLTKIESIANVSLTSDERQEFFKTLAHQITQDRPTIVWET